MQSKKYFKENELKFCINKYFQQKENNQPKKERFYIQKIIQILEDLNMRVIMQKLAKYSQKYNLIQDEKFFQDQIMQLKQSILQQQLQKLSEYDPNRSKQFSYFTAIQENIIKYYVQIQVRETNYFINIQENDYDYTEAFDNTVIKMNSSQKPLYFFDNKDNGFVDNETDTVFVFKPTLLKLIQFIKQEFQKIKQNKKVDMQTLSQGMTLFIILQNYYNNKNKQLPIILENKGNKHEIDKQKLIQKLIKQNGNLQQQENPFIQTKIQNSQINKLQQMLFENKQKQ